MKKEEQKITKKKNIPWPSAPPKASEMTVLVHFYWKTQANWWVKKGH